MKQLRVIDYSFIRELRRAGQYYEANRLLEAFREDVKKAGKTEFGNQLKIDRLIKKSKGICVTLYCPNKAIKNMTQCKHCLSRAREAYHKNKK
ncbi:MAG: hypothetical protein KKD44_28815 [Proteobacteria bacterium]|nr:hypothetical protein [Pseudomonadota bacterium]